MATVGVRAKQRQQLPQPPRTPIRKPGRGSATTPSAGAATPGNTNLWETMLRDAMRRNRLPDGTLVFVGPQGCGKSSLLDTFLEGSFLSTSLANPSGGAAAAATAATVAATAPTTTGDSGPEGGAGAGISSSGGGGSAVGGGAGGAGDGQQQQAATALGFHPVLAYSYLDATDPGEQGPEREDSPPRVNVWCCSELEFEGLLQTVLRPAALGHMCVVVGVDLSRPWEIMEVLEKASCVCTWGGEGSGKGASGSYTFVYWCRCMMFLLTNFPLPSFQGLIAYFLDSGDIVTATGCFQAVEAHCGVREVRDREFYATVEQSLPTFTG